MKVLIKMMKMKTMKSKLIVAICIATLISGCANVQEWRKTVIENQITNIKTTEVYYKSDTGFDLGTEGLGEYRLFDINGIGR